MSASIRALSEASLCAAASMLWRVTSGRSPASNAAPMYVAPAPVVVYPAPRVMAPPVYGSAWAPPGHYKRKHHKRHWQHEHDRWEDGGRHGHGRY